MSEPLLKGRYELLSTLGRGSLTTTSLARDRETGQRCVVKVLSLRHSDSLKGHELLVREAETLRRVEHPRIPRLVDFFSEEGDEDTRVCLVQQHVEGDSLANLVSGGRRFDEAEAATIGAKVAAILEYLHELSPPVLHRDVKPANVLLTPGGRVYLVDFGAVRDSVRREPLLHPGGATVVGTRGYMPIEQFEGRAVPASDLYALGATLVHLLSGPAPLQLGKDGLGLDFRLHVSASPALGRLLERMLQPDWRDRPGSASGVREELERIAALAKRPSRSGRPRRPSRVALLATVSVALAAVGFVLSTLGRHEPAGGGADAGRAPRSAWLSSSPGVGPSGDPLPPGAARRLGTVRFRHGGAVRGVALTPDASRVVSAGEDGTVSVWSAETGKETRRFELGEPATDLALAPDGSRLLVGSERFWSARMWTLDGRDVARLLPMSVLPAPSVAVREVAWSGDGRLVATRTHESIDLWEGEGGRHRLRLPACPGGGGLAFVGGELLVGCGDGARLLDTRTGRETRHLALGASVTRVAVAPDGGQLAVAGPRGVTLVDLTTGERVELHPDPGGGRGRATSAAFAADGATLVTGDDAGRLTVWDTASRSRGRTIDGHTGEVTALALSGDGRTAVSGGGDGALHVWDVRSGAERSPSSGHAGAVRGLEFTADGSTLLSVASDATLRRWRPEGREEEPRSFEEPALGIFALSASRLLAVEEGRFHLLDAATGWEVTGGPLPRPSRRFAVSRASGALVVGTASELVAVEVESGRRRAWPVPRAEEPVAFSSDGRVLATLREEAERLAGRSLVLRDAGTGRELRHVAHRRGGPFGARCHSADGSFLMFNGGLWRLTGDPGGRLENMGYPGRAGACAVSPDGTRVAHRHPDDPETIVVGELGRDAGGGTTLRRSASLEGHRGALTALAFSPDSRTLATGDTASSILVWDVSSLPASRAARAPAEKPEAPVLALSLDGEIGGPGVSPVRLPAAFTRLRLVPGRVGQALQLDSPLRLPEARALRVPGDFTLALWFRANRDAVSRGSGILASSLVSLDLGPHGQPLLFLHSRGGGHYGVDLGKWIGSLEADRWYHVGVAHRRDEGTTRVCVDAVCGPGPSARDLSDRAREIELCRGRPGERSGIAIDELAVYDRALSDDELARAGGGTGARTLSVPGPDRGRPVPGLPAEARPLPPEGRPEGRDVRSLVAIEQREELRAFRFTGELARAEALDVAFDSGLVWVGTSQGLLRHDPTSGEWHLWDETSGLRGPRLYRIAVVGGSVVVDSSVPTGPGTVRGVGLLALDRRRPGWRTLDTSSAAWDLEGDGGTLWLATRDGAEARDLASGARRRFEAGEGKLLHRSVHAIRRQGASVWFAMLGEWVEARRDFEGGGVSVLDERTGTFESHTERAGLARAYSCDLFVDEREAFVAHWDRERGLSRLDRQTGRWERLVRSRNGVDLGGMVLAGDAASVYVGQPGGLVRYDRRSGEARVWRERDGIPGFVISAIAVGDDAVWAGAWSRDQDGVRVTGIVRVPRRP